VGDLAALLGVMAGRDVRAPQSLADVPGGFVPAVAQDLKGCRVGWLGNLQGHLAVEAGVLEACEAGLRRMEGLGAAVEPMKLGFAPERVWASWCTWRHWLVAGKLKPHFDHHPEALKPEARWECERGGHLSAADVYAASLERSAFYRHLSTLFEHFDVLALPSAQCWPFPAEWNWPREIAGRPMDTYHRWMEVVIYASLTGLPALSVPTGFSPEGWPMGLQLIGRPQGEAALLQVAAAYELAIAEWLARRPPGA
jgi:amidase